MNFAQHSKTAKLIFFTLISLLITTSMVFLHSTNQTIAQTIDQEMTTQQPAVADNYPPFIPAPETAIPVMVTVELRAKDPVVLEQHLKSAKVIPTTRLASGNNYSWTVRDRQNSHRFMLIQQWNSVEQQQGYIAWREKRGDLAQLRELLTQDPVVSYLSLTDLNTLPAQIK